jgi:hypothetical protein
VSSMNRSPPTLFTACLPMGTGRRFCARETKVYLAGIAVAPSVLLKGKAMLQDDAAWGRAVETAFLKVEKSFCRLPQATGWEMQRKRGR